jgi:hypothetical protein
VLDELVVELELVVPVVVPLVDVLEVLLVLPEVELAPLVEEVVLALPEVVLEVVELLEVPLLEVDAPLVELELVVVVAAPLVELELVPAQPFVVAPVKAKAPMS